MAEEEGGVVTRWPRKFGSIEQAAASEAASKAAVKGSAGQALGDSGTRIGSKPLFHAQVWNAQ